MKLSPRWHFKRLLTLSQRWLQRKRHQLNGSHEDSAWWSFVHTADKQLSGWVEDFIAGRCHFEPMKTYYFPGDRVVSWPYRERLWLSLLLDTIKPMFSHLISRCCLHLQGPGNGVKTAIDWLQRALDSGNYHYVIRADIKNYYASIDRKLLTEQIEQCFDDSRVVDYLTQIITIPIIEHGNVINPDKGIPIRSSISPFFGALYLNPVDRYFEAATGVFYLRYMDDIIILTKTKKQFCRAKKKLKALLKSLKLQFSPKKTLMAPLTKGFHFLGVNFALAQTKAEENPVTVTLHPRSARRALANVSDKEEDSVSTENVLRYLRRWANWWTKTVHPLCHYDCLSLWFTLAWNDQPQLVRYAYWLMAALPSGYTGPRLADTRWCGAGDVAS